MKSYTILLYSTFLLLFSGCTTEEIYITYVEEEEVNEVTVSVVYIRVGDGHVQEAWGKVKNHGPKPIRFTRVYLGSNYAASTVVSCSPPTLMVGEIGEWQMQNGLPGTSIQQKEAWFDIWDGN
tara:strand:- start:255 stop:623 length:369 start_codon:yes stop_codon:yes gene_type:complete